MLGGRVLGAARSGVLLSSGARPLKSRRRAASPALAAAVRAPRGGGARAGAEAAAGGTAPSVFLQPLERGGDEYWAKLGRNHEPEFPQISDPALLRLQSGRSQEQGEPRPAVCVPSE